MFIKVRRLFTAGAILALLLLFILPGVYIRQSCRELSSLAMAVAESRNQADFEKLYAGYDEFSQTLDFFVPNVLISPASQAMERMKAYTEQGEATELWRAARDFCLALGDIAAAETLDSHLFL
ncbi:MAG: hypothetical protein IJR17_07480 [Clostridia bacterium]|nr:hypothetical protein [Clostridia bacterium]